MIKTTQNKLNYFFVIKHNRVRIFQMNKELILDELSLIAIGNKNRKILSSGQKAIEYFKNNSDSSHLISPIKNGVIDDFDMAVALFKYWRKKKPLRSFLRKPHVNLFIACGMADVYKQGFIDCVSLAGFKLESVFETKYDDIKKITMDNGRTLDVHIE